MRSAQTHSRSRIATTVSDLTLPSHREVKQATWGGSPRHFMATGSAKPTPDATVMTARAASAVRKAIGAVPAHRRCSRRRPVVAGIGWRMDALTVAVGVITRIRQVLNVAMVMCSPVVLMGYG